jgi:hypothetical protein
MEINLDELADLLKWLLPSAINKQRIELLFLIARKKRNNFRRIAGRNASK